MKTLDQFIDEHYIKDDYELEKFVESFYEDEESNIKLKNLIVENYKDVSESLEQPKYKLKHISRLILIGTEFSESIKMLSKDKIRVEYANPENLTFTLDEKSISINSGKNTISIKDTDSAGTVILMRSGYTDKNIAFMLQRIEDMGILILNPVEPVAISANKFNTAQLLSKYDIPQPKYCLITANDASKDDHNGLDKKLKSIYKDLNDDSKFVCKILEGHGGKGVFLCNKSNILSICQCLFKLNEHTKIIVQEFKEIKDGDIRVNVVTLNGKQEIFNVCMRQKKSKDFRTNLSLGNTIKEDIKLSKEQERIAKDAAKASGLIWAGVDLMPTISGENFVIEINGAAGPMSSIDDEEAIKTNYNFYKELIDCINSICK